MKTKPSNARAKRKRSTHAERYHGEPIDRTKSYTSHQLKAALAVSDPTMYRYRKHLDLDKFATKLNGSWQITGEQYHAWLNWRREQAKN